MIAQLCKLASTAPWDPVWRELALLDARGIDHGMSTGQYNIVSVMQSRLRDCMDRLGNGATLGPEDASDWEAFARDL